MNQRNFFILFFLAILISIGVSWYRYVVKEDFVYFITEEETPGQFDLNTYRNLGI